MSLLWSTEYSEIVKTFARSNVPLREDGAVVDDRPADEALARSELSRRDALLEQDLMPRRHRVRITAEGEDEEDVEDVEEAVARANIARAHAAEQAAKQADARLAHDLSLDRTETSAKEAAAAAGAQLYAVADSAVHTQLDKRKSKRSLCTPAALQALSTLTTTLPPDTWLLPSQDGDFKDATHQAYTSRGATRLGAASRDVLTDALAPLGLPQLLDSSAEEEQLLACKHCGSDLVKLPSHRLSLRAGKDLLEYLSPERSHLFLTHFCDECIVHNLDAIITTDGHTIEEILPNIPWITTP